MHRRLLVSQCRIIHIYVQTSHKLYGSFAERDLQRKAFCASVPHCVTLSWQHQMHRMPSVAGLFPQKSHIIHGSFEMHRMPLCTEHFQQASNMLCGSLRKETCNGRHSVHLKRAMNYMALCGKNLGILASRCLPCYFS